MGCSCIAVDELMQKAVFLLKKKNHRIKGLKSWKILFEMECVDFRNEQKKNSILEAENLQLRERIRALEKKIGIYAPGIKDPAHEKERGE